MSMVLDLVDDAGHGHVLAEVLLDALVAGAGVMGQPRLVKDTGQSGHVGHHGVEGHHAEGRGRHAVLGRLVLAGAAVDVL